MKSPQKPHYLTLLATILAIFLAAVVVENKKPNLIKPIAHSISDLYYLFLSKSPNKEIIFVAIDHASVKKLGRWPWARDLFAEGIRKLGSASVIVLDMVFSEETDHSRDEILATAFPPRKTIGGVFIDTRRDTFSSPSPSATFINSAVIDTQGLVAIKTHSLEQNIPIIDDALPLIGALNTLPDADSRLRKYPIGFEYGGLFLPSIGLQALRLYKNSEISISSNSLLSRQAIIESVQIPIDKHGLSRPTLYPENKFKTISFSDLTQAVFDTSSLDGKIVIVGVTEAGITDIKATPHGQYPGPLIHASFISSALNNESIREISLFEHSIHLAAFMALALLALKIRITSLRLGFYFSLLLSYWILGLISVTYFHLWVEPATTFLGLILSAISIEAWLLSQQRRKISSLQVAFSSYLSPELVKQISLKPESLALGGERRNITVLFSDIRGFTSLSESIQAELLAEVMNIYFQPMTEAIFRHHGTLDKYIGDAIMAIFNAPLSQENHALAACRAAIEMQNAQVEINKKLHARGIPPLKTGIGINTGDAVVGNFGSTVRFSYTALGDTVNLASRLESATKKLGADILISESTQERVSNHLHLEYCGEIEIPGKQHRQRAYKILHTQ